MALQIGTTLSAASSTYNLSTTDDILVVAGATITATGGTAIIGTGAEHSATVLGTVFGTFAGIDLGDDFSSDFNNRVTVGATGSVLGDPSINSVGVRLYGAGALVMNEGLISGGNGIVFSVSTGTATVLNSGSILGSLHGVRRFGGTTGDWLIENSGLIQGVQASISANFTAAIEEVHNRGRIVGLIDLQGGNDIVDNRRGTIEGDVDLGADNDSFDNRDGHLFGSVLGGTGNDSMIGNAAEAEVFDGGDGLDSLDFRFGPAVTVALDASFDNAGAALGDTYTAFERITGSVQGDVIRGNAQANQLLGQGGADVLDGAAGADLIRGGLGLDTLTGGLGNDIFRFQTLAECGDVITDFLNVAGDNDKFQIVASAFGGGLVAGALAATQFQSRADNVAQDADDRFIFRTTDRTLWFDADGNGAGAAALVADLQAGATLTAADIQLI